VRRPSGRGVGSGALPWRGYPAGGRQGAGGGDGGRPCSRGAYSASRRTATLRGGGRGGGIGGLRAPVWPTGLRGAPGRADPHGSEGVYVAQLRGGVLRNAPLSAGHRYFAALRGPGICTRGGGQGGRVGRGGGLYASQIHGCRLSA